MSPIILPLALPLAGAALSTLLGRWPRLRQGLSVVTLAAMVAVSIVLLVEVSDGSMVVVHLGGWPWPLGITLVVDLLSALMVLISAVMLLAVLVYAIGSPRTADSRGFFHPVYLVMAAGVCLSFVTGDLFNLFVAFEVTLTASYVLITFGGSRPQVRHGITYVIINLVASVMFITAVALTYAATGTVNMADLVGRLGDLDPGLRAGLGVLFLVVFGIKAAIFPLFFWLPDSYPVAPSPVTAIFAGLLTKVGVYAIIRTQTLLFPESEVSPLLLTVAALTMVVGVLGAISQDDVKRILSFHIVSQIGYVIFGLALFTVAGLAAAVFFVVHQIIVKTALLLVGGLVEERTGTSALREIGGMLHLSPMLATLFLLSALSLAGLPPFSGFVSKLTLVQSGISAGTHVTVAVSLLVSMLTLLSMMKIWVGVFLGDLDEGTIARAEGRRFPKLMVAPTVALVTLSLAFVLAAAPIYSLSSLAAEALIDPSTYVTAVRGG